MYGRQVITAVGDIAGDVGVLDGVTETVVPVHYDLRNDLDAAQEGRQRLQQQQQTGSVGPERQHQLITITLN